MRLRDFAAKRVVLWGAGRESAAVIRALHRAEIDAQLLVVDESNEGATELEGVAIERGQAFAERLATADVIVRSPGISRYRPELAAAQRAGVVTTTATAL